MRLLLAFLAYAVPTFILGYVWHLVLFKSYYDALAIYRSDIIVPFGLLAILLQSALFAWLYERAIAQRRGAFLMQALAYAAVGATLSWTYTTLAVAAKNVMASVPDYLLIETAFTIVQWLIVAPLTVAAFRGPQWLGPAPSNEAAR
jgi:hypothetical protein